MGRAFAKAYEQKTGLRLEKLSQSDKRPDLMFECGALRYGVELFEVDQLYGERALANELTNAIYAEIERRNLSDRYVGLAIQSPDLLKYDWDEEVQRQWEAKGISTIRKGIQASAREVVDLLVNTVASPKDAPHITKAKFLEVDQEKYPALAIVSKHLLIGQCNPKDELCLTTELHLRSRSD